MRAECSVCLADGTLSPTVIYQRKRYCFPCFFKEYPYLAKKILEMLKEQYEVPV